MSADIRKSLELTQKRIDSLNKSNPLISEEELKYPSIDRHFQEDMNQINDGLDGSHEIKEEDFKVYTNNEAILRGTSKIAENTINWEFKKSESDPLLLDNNSIIKINESFLNFISEIKKEFISWNERWDERFRSI